MQLASRKFTCLYCGEQHESLVARCPGTGDPLEIVHKFEGHLLDGKYRVGRVIAEGGMGLVYEGLHEKLDRLVAIKFLMHATSHSKKVLERFETEARIAASVGHRNIVDTLDMGTTEHGIPYIVMEYLEGSDLRAMLDAAGRMPREWAVDITVQILSALRAVHARGIVHRDLKPENVFLKNEVDGSLTVKLVDFGVSRLGKNRPRKMSLTRTGAVFGTPRYMSPEQARGEKDVDHRADLYSCGVMLYRMLTGSFPHDEENFNKLLIAVGTKEPLHIAKQGVALPSGLEAVVMWALSREPADRFADADEFIEALLPYRDAGADVNDDSVNPDDSPPSDGIGWGVSHPSFEGADLSRVENAVTVRPAEDREIPPAAPRMDDRKTPVMSEEMRRQADPDAAHEPKPEPEPTAAAQERPPASGARALDARAVVVCGMAAALLVVLAGVVIGLVLHVRSLEERMQLVTEAVAGPAVHQVTLTELPEGSRVYVDDVLHTEMPLRIPAAPSCRLRVEVDGREVWESEVAVLSDLSLRVDP